jgi:hypothetical protein
MRFEKKSTLKNVVAVNSKGLTPGLPYGIYAYQKNIEIEYILVGICYILCKFGIFCGNLVYFCRFAVPSKIWSQSYDFFI